MIPFTIFLDEARRNPNHPAQQKKTAIEVLSQYENRDDIYITYTKLNKVGVNPKSKYYTPTAVYTYPLRQVWNDIKIYGVNNVPFAATDANYIFVIKARKNVMDVSDYTERDLWSDIEKIKRYYDENDVDEAIELIRERTVRSQYETDKQIKEKPFGFLKMVLFNIAKGKTQVFIAKALLKLGYEAVSDKRGTGQIHTSEPTQAFFITSNSYKVIDKIDIKEIDKATETVRDYVKLLKSGKSIPKDELENIIQLNPTMIKYVKNPSDELVIMAYDTRVGERYSPKNHKPKENPEDWEPDNDDYKPSEGIIRGIKGIMKLPEISDRVFAHIASNSARDIISWVERKEKTLTPKRLEYFIQSVSSSNQYVKIEDIIKMIKKTPNVSSSDIERYVGLMPKLKYYVDDSEQAAQAMKDEILAMDNEYTIFNDFPYTKAFFGAILEKIKQDKNAFSQARMIGKLYSYAVNNKKYKLRDIPKNVRQGLINILQAYHDANIDDGEYKALGGKVTNEKILDALKSV